MSEADSSDTGHPRSDEVRGRERHHGGYGESGGFGDQGFGDRGDFGDQGVGEEAERKPVPEGGTAEEDRPASG